jgi:hypothetical protein
VLKGRYRNGVTVTGFCAVNQGPARVIGTLDLEPGSALAAAYGKHHSRLTVVGNVMVERSATLVLGCNTTEFPCFDDPASSNPNVKPTLSSSERVTGDLRANGALSLLFHGDAFGGSIVDSGGGGGLSCKPPSSGPFAAFHSPVYSAFEDSTIGQNLAVSHLTSCWMGVARDSAENISLTDNKFGDPDAIEVLSNQVSNELSCRGNSHVWDTAETGHGLFPRKLARNHVGGEREGQCRRASRVKKGQRAKGPF